MDGTTSEVVSVTVMVVAGNVYVPETKSALPFKPLHFEGRVTNLEWGPSEQ